MTERVGERGRAAGLVLVSLNLRIAVAAVAPVLTEIQRADRLSSAAAGLLTTVPVVCFGLFAFAAPALTRTFGPDRLLTLTLAALTAGILLRLAPGPAALLAGTTIIGAAVGVANVVLPALVKRDFAHRAALMTGLYVTALSGGAALAAGVTVPLQHAADAGWTATLALWAVPAAAGLAAWTVLGGRRAATPVAAAGGRRSALWRSPAAWAVTAFMGLQSLSYYATLTWIPTILEHAGLTATAAGALLSLAGVVSLPGAFLAPLAARRVRRPAAPAVVAVGLCAAGLCALAAAPAGAAIPAMVVLGFGQGSAFALALGAIVRRSADTRQAGELSTMAQGTGYLVASLGPVGVGALHDLSRGWVVPLSALVVLLLPELIAGVLAAGPSRAADVVPAGPLL